MAVHFEAEREITAVLPKYELDVNLKTTIIFWEFDFIRCFIKLSFIRAGAFDIERVTLKPLILRLWGPLSVVQAVLSSAVRSFFIYGKIPLTRAATEAKKAGGPADLQPSTPQGPPEGGAHAPPPGYVLAAITDHWRPQGGGATGAMAPPLASEGGAILSFGPTFDVKAKR